MGSNRKIGKSGKRYFRNKANVVGKVKKQKMVQAKKREEHVKTEKLKKTPIEDDEQVQEEYDQQYLKLSSKKNQQQQRKKDDDKQVSSNEVQDFLAQLQNNPDFEMDEDLEDLVKDTQDKDTVDGDDAADGDDDDDDDKGNDDDKPIAYGDDSDDDDEVKLNQIIAEESKADHFDKFVEDKQPLTKELIAAWIHAIKTKHSLPHCKKLVLAFFAAAYQDEIESGSIKENESLYKVLKAIPFSIPSHEFFLRVTVACLKYCKIAFQYHAKFDPESGKLPNKLSSGWQQIRVMVTSLLKSCIHLMENVQNQEQLSVFLKYMEDLLPYFGHFIQESRKLLKCLLNLLGHEIEFVRFRSFLLIRKMSILYPYPFLDLCIKGVYFTLVQNAQDYSPHNFKVIDFLKNCVVELCGIDLDVAYQHAFVYIRELAITLRRAMQPEKTSYALVYNWKYVNCFDTWIKVICAFKEKNVADLIYPISQMILGICELKQDANFIPVRLKAVSMANILMQQTGQYIPISTILLQLLESRELRDKKKVNEPRCMNKWEFLLRVRSKLMATKQCQQVIQEEIFYYILEYLSINGKSIAFPEMAFPILKALKTFIREHSGSFTNFQRKNMQKLVQKIQENSEFITSARSKLNISPAEIHSKKIAFLGNNAKVPIIEYFESEKKQHDLAVADRLQAVIGADLTADSDLDESDDESSSKKSKKQKVLKKKAAADDNEDAEEAGEEEEQPKKPAKKDDKKQLKKKQQPAAEQAKQKKQQPQQKRKREADEDGEVAISGGAPAAEATDKKPAKKKQKKPHVKKSAIPAEDVVKPLDENDF